MNERQRNDFPEGIKKDVRFDQNSRCADCGTYCNGHPDKPRFEVHHVLPDCQGGTNDRKNAVGLCPTCHRRHDEAALCDGKLFYETLLEDDRFNDARDLARKAGLSDRALTAPGSLRRVLTRKPGSDASNPENALQKGGPTVVFEVPTVRAGKK